LVPPQHAGAVGAGRLSRDLCDRALLHLSSCSICASRSTCRACPDRPRSAPSAGTAHLARCFICLSGPGLLVVASLPSKSCQLLPHETSSQGWLILIALLSALFLRAVISQRSQKFPGSAGVPVLSGLSSALSTKGVLRMTLLPVADGARLLGIHPKTLCHWLTTAHLPLAAHPTDARIRCVAQADLLEVARLHSRPLPHLSAGAALESYAASALAAEQAKPLPAHAPLGCPALVSWAGLLALSGGHRPLNARLLGTGGCRPASSGGRALRH